MAERKKHIPNNPIRPSDMIPTRRVRIRASGAEVEIAAKDFDPALHEDPAAEAPSLEGFTVAQLKAMADERGIEYADNAKKADLITALQAPASS